MLVAQKIRQPARLRLERERMQEVRGSIFAGIRTFHLIVLLGVVSGQLSGEVGIVVIPLGLLV